MNKYLMAAALLACISLSMARPTDFWMYNKWQVADCKYEVLTEAYDDVVDDYCASEETLIQMESILNQMHEEDDGSDGILDQMFSLSYCGCSDTDWVCIARYRQQFRSQQATFNSLVTSWGKLAMQAGRDSLAEECITREGLFSDSIWLSYNLMACNGGMLPPPIVVP